MPLARTENKATEEALSGDQFRRLVDLAADGFYHDLDGLIRDVNNEACRSLGYTREELLALNVADIEVGFDPEGLVTLWHSMAAGTAKTVEGVHRRKDGTTFPVEVRITFDDEDSRPSVLALVRDISARKEMEAALIASRSALEAKVEERTRELRASEQYWRSITENAGDLISVSDLTGAIRYQSPSVRDILGYAPDERIGEEARTYTHPDDIATTRAAIAALQDDPHLVTRLETRVRHKAGHWVDLQVAFSTLFDGAGRPAGFVFNARDVTEQKKADEEIRRSQDLLRSMMDNIPAAVFLKDEAGRYQVVNRTFEEWYRAGRTKAVGKTPGDFFPAAQASLYAAHDKAVLETGATIEEERRVSYPDGKERDVLIIKFSVPGMGQGGRGVGAINLDITKRLEAERALRSSDEQLRLIANSLPALIVQVNRHERFTFINKTFEEWQGRTRNQIIGASFEEMYPGVYADFRPRIEAALAGQAQRFGGVVPFGDGQTRNVDVTFVPDIAPSGAVRGFFALIQDVTALHEAQTALREREAHWRTIIENTADIISVSNADGTFSYQSPSIERILGYGQAERIGRPAHEFAHPDDKAQAQQAMARLRADPSSVQALESRVKTQGRPVDHPCRHSAGHDGRRWRDRRHPAQFARHHGTESGGGSAAEQRENEERHFECDLRQHLPHWTGGNRPGSQ